jgi:hypothetical protein
MSRTDEGRNLDASQITEEGVNVGDLDPDEWGYLTIDFITVSGASNEVCDHITATAGWPLEVSLPIDNAKNIVRHDVVLSWQLSGGPDDFVLAISLSEAGRVVLSHTIYIAGVSRGSGVSLRYRDATVHNSTRAQVVDASGGEVIVGDMAPRSGLVFRIRYEIIPNDD